jgi:hypothetical protein
MTNKSNKKIFRDCIFSAKESQDCTNEQNEKKNHCTTIKFFFNIIKKKVNVCASIDRRREEERENVLSDEQSKTEAFEVG